MSRLRGTLLNTPQEGKELLMALLIHAQHQGICGGFTYSPATSRNFPIKNASVDSFKLSAQCVDLL